MKKILSVLAVTMCGAALMLSACGGSGNDEEELTEVTVTEAYETLSTFSEKVKSAIESDNFNISFQGKGIWEVEEESESDIMTYDLSTNGLYDGTHFYADIVQKAPDVDYYTYDTYRDTQHVREEETETVSNYSYSNDSIDFEISADADDEETGTIRNYSYDSIGEAIASYYDSDTFAGFNEGLYLLQEIQWYEQALQEYENENENENENVEDDSDYIFESIVKLYSETDYLNIVISYTIGSEGYTYSVELSIKVNLAAGLTADDFEPISAE